MNQVGRMVGDLLTASTFDRMCHNAKDSDKRRVLRNSIAWSLLVTVTVASKCCILPTQGKMAKISKLARVAWLNRRTKTLLRAGLYQYKRGKILNLTVTESKFRFNRLSEFVNIIKT